MKVAGDRGKNGERIWLVLVRDHLGVLHRYSAWRRLKRARRELKRLRGES